MSAYKRLRFVELHGFITPTRLQDRRLGDSGSTPRRDKRFMLSTKHPHSLWVQPMGLRPLALDVKPPRCEADHSCSPSAKVKKSWSYLSSPPHLLGMPTDNLTSTLPLTSATKQALEISRHTVLFNVTQNALLTMSLNELPAT